jgi:hypothetical protein
LFARAARDHEGELSVVVVLADGSPAFVPVSATDVLGVTEPDLDPEGVLSVAGVRRLRALVAVGLAKAGPAREASRLWKVVRHRPGADPFERAAEVCSAHGSEAAASRARDRRRVRLEREVGRAEAARWRLSVLADHAGTLGEPRRKG